MKKIITLEWLIAAGTRALKTFAQVVLGYLTIGGAFGDFEWGKILSIAAVATIYSMLMSVVGLPEVGTDGTLKIDTSDPEKDVYRIDLDSSLDTLACKKKVVLIVDTKANLS